MNDTKIHEGLENKVIRDFLGREITKTWGARAVDVIQRHIQELQHELQRARRQEALLALMEYLGWDEFDVPDHVSRTPGEEYWMQFIGTDEEFSQLQHRLQEESK